MELYQLQSFVVIAQAQNLTRAAKNLNLSQSAMSSQLKALETELGVSLFKRGARGMRLTLPGTQLLEQATKVLGSVRQLREQAQSLNQQAGELVTLGLNASPAFLRIADISHRLTQLHGEVRPVFQTSQTVKTAHMLRQGQIDIGFHYGRMDEGDIVHHVVAQVRVCVVVPTRMTTDISQFDWAQIAALPWIWVGDDCPFYTMLMERLERQQLMPQRRIIAVDEQIVRELVADGQGVAMMREDEALPLVKRGRIQIWEPGWLTLPLGVAWLSRNASQPRIRAVVDVVQQVWQPLDEDSSGVQATPYWL
ncbi:MAG: LysR family transcriptional regulator [Thermodesulfobacteriota bacterium]|nr:LysR family transcriptional regulator [Thermodesulfobacteriota bacterium]